MKRKTILILLLAGLAGLFVARCSKNTLLDPNDPNIIPPINKYKPTLLSAIYEPDSIFMVQLKPDSIPDTVIISTAADIDTTPYITHKVKDTCVLSKADPDSSKICSTKAYPHYVPKNKLTIDDQYGRHVMLIWTKPTDISVDSLYQYFIYRGTRSGDLDSLGFVSGLIDTIETATDIEYDIIVEPKTNFIDIDVVPGPVADITFYYKVSAVKLNWYEGLISNEMLDVIPHDTTVVVQ